MAEEQKKRDIWLILLYAMLLIVGLTLTGVGVYVAALEGELVILALGVLTVVVPTSIYPLVADRDSGPRPQSLSRIEELLASMNERLLLSDQAKRIAYREHDREAMQRAIEEDIRLEDYDAAMVLANEMANTYGYRETAEQYRQQIIDLQAERRRKMIGEGIGKIDEECARFDWDGAFREASRLKRLFPDEPDVTGLRPRIEEARESHKRGLEREFLEAAARDDIDHAMELLRELDKYLTETEAAQYMETARGVIGKKKENLGVQFKMAWNDRDWVTAMRVGNQIIREFPNSRMSEEVRGLLDVLRQRAADQQVAESGQGVQA